MPRVSKKKQTSTYKITENEDFELLEENTQEADDPLACTNEDGEEYDEDGPKPITTSINVKSGAAGCKIIVVEEVQELVYHICGKCSSSFNDVEALRAHLPLCREREHENGGQENKFDEDEAMEAARIYESPVNIKTHCHCCAEDYEVAHVGHIRCPQCPKSFKTAASIERHKYSLHSESEEFPCSQCNARCPNQAVLDLHLLLHARGKPFSCQQCGKNFTRKYHLERHLLSSTCAGKKPAVTHVCDVCQREFNRVDNLREHLRTHLGDKEKKRDFRCPYCPKAFYGSSLLNIHIRVHTKEKPFPCDLCDKFFPSTAALRKHRRTHTGEKPYACSVCDARFSAKETLNRHFRRHTGDKRYHCEICGKKFIQNSQLQNHLVYHNGTQFECPECDEKFPRKVRLREHIKFAHLKAEMMPCEMCSKSFPTKTQLNRHISAVHYGNKDFTCDHCNKAFATKSALTVHTRTHMAADPVKCKECAHTFRRFDCYRRHLSAKHRDLYMKLVEEAERRRQIAPTPTEHAAVFEITVVNEEDEMTSAGSVAPMSPISVNQFEPTDDSDEIIISDLMNVKAQKFDEPPIELDKKDALKQQLQAMARLEEQSMPVLMTDEWLKRSVSQLLEILIGIDTLEMFGWPDDPVDEVLISVIQRCGYEPILSDYGGDELTVLRENIKLLFAHVIDNDDLKMLLNNHTVDEVIQYVLKTSNVEQEDEIKTQLMVS